MPKKSFPITLFKGLNTQADSRNIDNTELQEADNVLMDKIGKVRLGLKSAVYNSMSLIFHAVVNAGYGLFSFSSDYNFDSPPAAANTNYLVIQNEEDFTIIEDYTGASPSQHIDDTSGEDLKLSTTTLSDVKPIYSYINGVLRISDTNFDNTHAEMKWLGYINETLFDTTNEVNYEDWIIENAEIEAPTVSVSDTTNTVAGGTSGYWDNDGGSPAVPDVTSDGRIVVRIITTTGTGTWGASVWIYATYIYEDNQESLPEYIGKIYETTFPYRIQVDVFANPPLINKRIVGMNVYYSESYGSELYLLAKVDFRQQKGLYDSVNNYWRVWTDSGAGVSKTGSVVLEDPPSTIIYEMVTDVAQDCESISAQYKASCIANGKMYIGNIKQNGETYNDRMIKSPLYKYDIFPSDNYIDVIVNDGDEIVKLIAVDDRILQFKKEKLYIIKLIDDYEELEESYINKGIEYPFQAVEMENGAAWCNKHGVYLYLNNKVIEISDKIKDDYKSFFSTSGAYPMIGYHKETDTIIIMRSNNTGISNNSDCYLFDVKNGIWTFATGYISGTKPITNFVNGIGGTILWVDSYLFNYVETVDITDTVDSSASSIITKDIDFGDPSRYKKIYGVYLTYKSNGLSGFKAYIIKDGEIEVALYNGNILPTTDGDLTTIYLQPSSIQKCQSVAVKLESIGTVPSDFEIKDMTIIYRALGVDHG